jgi:hypothetical protein
MTDFLTDFEPDLDFIVDEERDRQGFAGSGFCPSCGFRWDLHDNHNPLNKLPFGCPSETVARMEWGR